MPYRIESAYLQPTCNLAIVLALVCTTSSLATEASNESRKVPATVSGKSEPEDSVRPDAESDEPGEDEVVAGHSYHGEAFDDGPRQKAYLMPGTGKVDFKATTNNPQAQAFINQGVGQLHGFWYFEAERSFRQAAALDPECAIAYWGMAMANINNDKRAKGFIAEAVKRKGKASKREQLYIDALDAFWKADENNKKDRAAAYIKALENIVLEFPDDLDAKAWVVKEQWESHKDRHLPLVSYHGANALLGEVFAAEPMHPAHHFRIHLWDDRDAKQALHSAAQCGPSAPGIAHMWHMPGHIYSKLRRYHDAAWQQEASARVDHAYMIRDRVLPDQIHNFAHNNEWLIRDLIFIGAWRDALELAKNMVALPRHPRWNVPTNNRTSSYYGPRRLAEVLERFELSRETIELAKTPLFAAEGNAGEKAKRLRLLGRAYFNLADESGIERQLAELEKLLTAETAARGQAEDEAEKQAKEAYASETEKKHDKKEESENSADDAELKKRIEAARKSAARPFRNRINSITQATDELGALLLFYQGKNDEGIKLLRKSKCDALTLARFEAVAGNHAEAEKIVRKEVRSHRDEVIPLASLVWVLWGAGKKDEAKSTFEQLRSLSSTIDFDSPVFERLAPIAKELGLPSDWRLPRKMPDDLGPRPPLVSLGPKYWTPAEAADWTLPDASGQEISLKQFRGKPVVVIFYLGFGCLHCVEQLEAFAPMTKDFADAGIELVAISTDDQKKLAESLAAYETGKYPFPLVSDASLETFKAYRVYDDFEQQPLHATLLIDAEGKIRWQDISYEPFSDGKFLLTEAQRLLSLPPQSASEK